MEHLYKSKQETKRTTVANWETQQPFSRIKSPNSMISVSSVEVEEVSKSVFSFNWSLVLHQVSEVGKDSEDLWVWVRTFFFSVSWKLFKRARSNFSRSDLTLHLLMFAKAAFKVSSCLSDLREKHPLLFFVFLSSHHFEKKTCWQKTY